jgi:hypothetical protein
MPRNWRTNIGREIWWVALAITFVIFVSTAHVQTYLGWRGRGRAKVWDIWRDLTTDLPGGRSDLVKVAYVLIVVVFVASCFAGLWLALNADTPGEPIDATPSQPVETL